MVCFLATWEQFGIPKTIPGPWRSSNIAGRNTVQKKNDSLHLGGETRAKDGEAAKLKELPVGKILTVNGSASFGWLVMLVHSPVMAHVLSTTRDFSLWKFVGFWVVWFFCLVGFGFFGFFFLFGCFVFLVLFFVFFFFQKRGEHDFKGQTPSSGVCMFLNTKVVLIYP